MLLLSGNISKKRKVTIDENLAIFSNLEPGAVKPRACLLRSCSVGINRFSRLVGLVEFFRVLLAKKPFLVGLVAQLFQLA